MPVLDRIKGPIFELFDLMTGNGTVQETVIAFFAVAAIIFIVFPIRECARGYMAKYLGDDTGEREGRLTLNPLSHIDPMGALCMCFCCIGWSRTMPINLNRCTKTKGRTALFLTSLAGPVANILMSYIFVIVSKIIFMNITSTVMFYVWYGVYYVAVINVYLAVLNLLPIPPFDGCKILCSFLPRNGVLFFERYGQIIYMAFFFALILGLLDGPLDFLSDGVMWLLDKASFFLGTMM